jgi:transglutaminase-like putative cysteine protease
MHGAGATPPRPLSSYGLVAVSDVALAATGELAPAALALHAAALAAAVALRGRPRGWQRSGWVLNAGLVAVTGTSIALWVRGALALVALAQFAHLALALQLLDARARRSDFLLVALALFQMILAANLTDSPLFPPLLVAFVLAVVWTLVVHTLWMEALAAGEPWSARGAQAPGLLRTTLAASALSIALALVIFLVLPRVRSGSLAAPGLFGTPAAGFSDRVSLGDLGRIRQDPTVVLRVETLRGNAPPREAAYWRGLAFDRFDGRTWSVTPSRHELLAGAADLGVRLASPALRRPGAGPPSRPEPPDLQQRVVREPVGSGVLFAAGVPLQLEGSVGRLEGDVNGGVYAPETVSDRIHYTVETSTRTPSLADLRADRAAPPRGDPTRWLELPELSPEIHQLALRATEGAATDADRAAALERQLRRTGRYSDTPPPERPGDRHSPIETFLLDHTEGHCEYFASAMVVLLRSIGIPARLVNGFAGGRENEIGGFVELSRSDAHAWVEVHFERAGWVRYDPTPPDLRLRADALDWSAELRDVAGAVEHWWYRHVVEFDRSDQMRAIRSGWLAWRQWRDAREPSPSAGQRPDGTLAARFALRRFAPWLVAGAGLGALGLALGRWRRRRAPGRRLPAAYADALRLLERRAGLVRGDAISARDFARRAARAIPPAAAAAFWSLTESYLAERFGNRRSTAPRDALRTLRDTLRR